MLAGFRSSGFNGKFLLLYLFTLFFMHYYMRRCFKMYSSMFEHLPSESLCVLSAGGKTGLTWVLASAVYGRIGAVRQTLRKIIKQINQHVFYRCFKSVSCTF